MAGLSSESRRKMLCLIRSKSCKRCGGDLSVECDIYGVYIECIQCGATFNKNEYLPPNLGTAQESSKNKKDEPVDNYLKSEIPRPKVPNEQ